jgi:hypothetical protein
MTIALSAVIFEYRCAHGAWAAGKNGLKISL